MKKILGLDLGTASIGWAYVHEAEHEQETSEIIALGVRVNPLTTDEQKEFESGKSITTNASRRLKRGMRRNLQRYKLRRDALLRILREHGIINEDTILTEHGKDTTFETLRLRAEAATGRVELEHLARILISINRKRGYRSSRKVNNGDEGKLIDGMGIAKELYDKKLTPGQWAYSTLEVGKAKRIPDFYRSDLEAELEQIWHVQSAHYPEVLTDELRLAIAGQGMRNTIAIIRKISQREPASNKGKRAETQYRIYRWRSTAASEQLPIEEVLAVIVEVNKEINGSSGYLGAISDRSKRLYFEQKTVGQYMYEQVQANRHSSLRNQVFYRQDYLDEFERIWEEQRKHHPVLTPELKAEIRDVVIFFQRKLKSQKGLIRFCELESQEREIKKQIVRNGETIESVQTKMTGLRVAPRSSPLFQEFKIWQMLSNVVIRPRGSRKRKVQAETLPGLFDERAEVSALSLEEKQTLFAELNVKGSLSAAQAMALLDLDPKEWEMNYTKLEGNATNQALYSTYLTILANEGYDARDEFKVKGSQDQISIDAIEAPVAKIIEMIRRCFETLGINTGILAFDAELQGKAFSQQPAYSLWHLLYSYEEDGSATGNDRLYRLLEERYGFSREQAAVLASVPLLGDYGNLSAKAIRKLFPYIKENNYSTACELAGYRHSKESLTKEEIEARPLLDKLPILPKNSLRQPVVEKILNQMVNVINALIDKHSIRDAEGKIVEPFHFDEIRIELARELKKNAEERAKMTKDVADGKKRTEEITKRLREEFGIKHPSRNDIIRYRLYQELEQNGYRDIYHGKYISREELFSHNIDIEHIIPQARLFDDSFSNKTLSFCTDNRKKGERTAYDYIEADYNSELEDYVARVEELHQKGAISKAKYLKLLKRESEIGDGFIERDLRETQYIARKAKAMLHQISRRVVSTTGSVTDRLREDWGLMNLMKDINIEKYRALGLTEKEERRTGTVEVIKDWTKRNDHRHHAMDALTIAFTKPSHIQYLNNLNARKDERHPHSASILGIQNKETEVNRSDKSGREKRVFKLPMPNFRDEARKHLESILVSHKAKNKVTTRNRNKIKGSNAEPRVELTPRGQLHNETVYSRRKVLMSKATKLERGFTLEQVALIANPKIRQAVCEHIARYPSIEVALDSTTLKASPIIYKDEPLTEVLCFEERLSIHKLISEKINLKAVVDQGVRRILEARLAAYGNAKSAFSDLDVNPIWLNESQGISIKRVTLDVDKEGEALHSKRDHRGQVILDAEGKPIPTDFVQTQDNHHVAIYRDGKGKLQEYVMSFLEAVARAVAGLPIINRNLNADLGWSFVFSMKQNEIFVFPNEKTGFDPQEVDLLDPRNKGMISPNLFRVQKLSSKDYNFRHHLESSVLFDVKGVTFRRLRSTGDLEGVVKVRLDHLGNIVQVGEY